MNHQIFWFLSAIFFVSISLSQPKKIIRTIVGIPPYGGDGKLASNAFFGFLRGLHISNKNEVFIVDRGNHILRKIDKNGIISTIAGTPGMQGYSSSGTIVTNARFFHPEGITGLSNGDLLIADTSNHVIRKLITSTNTLTTVAGSTSQGFSGDGNLAIYADFNYPYTVFVPSWNEKEMYIADTYNHVIRKVFVNGTITTIAGTKTQYGFSGDGGFATQARLYAPYSVIIPSETVKDMYISDSSNHVIRKVFAENGTIITVAGVPLQCGYTNQLLCYPSTLLYVEEEQALLVASSSAIRKVFLTNQTVITIIGGVTTGYSGDDGPATLALLESVKGMTLSSQKELFFADDITKVIRKIDSNGIVRHVAGTPASKPIVSLNLPKQIVVEQDQYLYIADTDNQQIKLFNSYTNDFRILAGKWRKPGYNGENITATDALLRSPYSIVLHPITRELFFSDASNHLIRKIDTNGIISTVAGNVKSINTGPLATQFLLSYPTALLYHKNSLYICDSGNRVIRKLHLLNGTMEIVVGIVGMRGYSGDGGKATNATIDTINSIAMTKVDELYLADSNRGVIRKVDTNGTITTFGYPIMFLESIFLASSNEMYISTIFNVKKLWTNDSNFNLQFVAGSDDFSKRIFSGDNEDPLEAGFFGITTSVTTANQVTYIVESSNHIIRKIDHLCLLYAINGSLQWERNISSTVLQVEFHMNRTCQEQLPSFFELDNIPYLDLQYKSTSVNFKTITSNWNLLAAQQVWIDMSGQLLDIISIDLNGCHHYYTLVANCSLQKEYGIIPTDAAQNFLFFPSILSATFIHYFKISSLVNNLKIHLQFVNINLQQIELEMDIIATSESNTVEIMGLQHSTVYMVTISSTVEYSNGLELTSLKNASKLIETFKGIAPLGTVTQVAINEEVDALFISWQSIPLHLRGNMPISTLEIQMNNTMLISIAYDAEANTPSSYVVTYPFIAYNIKYSFQLRVCNALGCSEFSEAINGSIHYSVPIPSTLNTDTISMIVAIVIPILICLFIAIALLIVVLVIIVIIVTITKKNKKFENIVTNQWELESLDKEFRIEESKLDFSNSVAIGSGASGSVFTAKYFTMHVAVKLIHTTHLGIETDKSDFYNELQILSQHTQHANIIRFFGMYENKQQHSIGLVMEYCANGNVANYICQHHLSTESKRKLIQGIAQGMQYLHFHNIAHRDLKCENVLLDTSLTPKIIDFGFSRQMNEKQSNLTMNVGTAAYCAPEVIQLQTQFPATNNISLSITSQSKIGEMSYDKKCDVYSFAICMYVIYFETKFPYGPVTDPQLLFQLSTNLHLRPKVEEKQIPATDKWWIELMKTCWEADPEKRPNFEQICHLLDTK